LSTTSGLIRIYELNIYNFRKSTVSSRLFTPKTRPFGTLLSEDVQDWPPRGELAEKRVVPPPHPYKVSVGVEDAKRHPEEEADV
jgi:hypothetical protein